MSEQSRKDYLSGAETHEVFNVSEPLENYNAYREDVFLQQLTQSMGANWAESELTSWGKKTGSAQWIQWGFLANANPPRFHSHDAYGRRLDWVEYHPAYHSLMTKALGHGLHSIPWNQPGDGAHVYRAALTYLQTQVEQGHGCPVTMTFSCVPTLRLQPDLAEQWLPRILSTHYDPTNCPVEEKRGATIGMAMTEKQGGSDLRANTTRARPLYAPGDGQPYQLVGHKFFMSAPMSDAFLMLAQAEAGLSCFLVPRWCPGGEKNGLIIQRLKDKMGNVSNASSEVELRGALGWLIGDEGRGVANILEMGALTRFDCMLASAAAMRQAVVQAVHHCSQRRAFGKTLVEQPLMQNVLADLIVESDAALVLAMRMARALDHSHNPDERALLRVGTAIGKYWNCKRAPGYAYEAMECLGGSGVMNDFMTARLYREAPINAIWEGSGNIQCLDVLRALERKPECVQALKSELARTQGLDQRLDRHIAKLFKLLEDQDGLVYGARTLVESMALALQGSLLLRYGDARVADAFLASRIAEPAGLYGNLPRGVPARALIERTLPMYG
ncbi:acyl-CoA dehydrogenase family protein [Marinimicrobium sp. ABcell2]|uniref:acyl-CoA dehydrogenase family protein n=1 Tax=Marinimicrobium sp. ABcell2 TaxID=3069751 RepID=UPI0027AEE37D|nr:acyl-CoA dehydrogenase family protein [Marinimicrobium sp. ABcell2]MDQ2077198.1 acyl-CoA dehydrogenase family protein [Marinimicrobium sp. ABcell2]